MSVATSHFFLSEPVSRSLSFTYVLFHSVLPFPFHFNDVSMLTLVPFLCNISFSSLAIMIQLHGRTLLLFPFPSSSPFFP
jgi:hypothetical protein